MFPHLFDFLPWNLSKEAPLLLFSFILMLTIIYHLSPRFEIPRWKFFIIALFPLYFSFVFGHLFSLFFDGKIARTMRYLREFSTLDKLRLIFDPFSGGVMMYGAFFGILFGVLLGGYLFFRKDVTKIASVVDITVVSFSFTMIFKRIQCFVDGCCYGVVSPSFGVVFPPDSSAARQLVRRGLLAAHHATPPLIPTQLISAVANFFIFMFVFSMASRNGRKKPPLFYTFSYVLLYSLFRFSIDFVRWDITGYFFILTTSQIISIVGIIASLTYFSRYRKKIRNL